MVKSGWDRFGRKAEHRFPGADHRLTRYFGHRRGFPVFLDRPGARRARLRNGLRTRHAGSNVLECTYAREYATFRMQLHNVFPPLQSGSLPATRSLLPFLFLFSHMHIHTRCPLSSPFCVLSFPSKFFKYREERKEFHNVIKIR